MFIVIQKLTSKILVLKWNIEKDSSIRYRRFKWKKNQWILLSAQKSISIIECPKMYLEMRKSVFCTVKKKKSKSVENYENIIKIKCVVLVILFLGLLRNDWLFRIIKWVFIFLSIYYFKLKIFGFYWFFSQKQTIIWKMWN